MISRYSPIILAVFLFPILIATVKHAGGVIYSLLFLGGIFLGWPVWKTLESWEKKVLIGFSVFIVLVSFSLVNTQEFSSGIKRLEKFALFPLFVPMYLLMKKFQIETGKTYLLGMFAASFIMFGQAYYQTSILGWERAVGAYNSIIFGDVAMLVGVIMTCALLTLSKIRVYYVIGCLAVCVALYASALSGSKGAWLALPVVVVWFLWEKRKNLSPFYLISIAIIFSLSILGTYNIPHVKNRIASAVSEYQEYTHNETKSSPVQTRIELWRDSITIWKEHPIIGTGLGDFRMDVTHLVDDGLSNTQDILGHAHNIYLDTLAISGLIGLSALLILVLLMPFLIFRSFWKTEHDQWMKFYALAGMATIIAFAVFGLTEAWTSRNPFVRTYLMSILVFMSSIAIRKQRLEPRNIDEL
jgi:O-antigen ligase